MRNELFIGGFSVDTIETLDISITKSVYSIVDPSKRQSDYSKTVAIAGSKNNDNIFKSLFDVNFSIRNTDQLNPDFNPSIKASCIYLQDSNVQIDGYCQLNEIVILENNKVIYNITIYGKSRDFFAKLTNKNINEISSTEDTTWDDATIQATWSDITSIVQYPMLDKGLSFDWRNGSYQGAIHGTDFNCFKPWVKVQWLLQQIILDAGFEYQSSFIDDAPVDNFGRLILEGDVKQFQLEQSAITGTNIGANRTSNAAFSVSGRGVANSTYYNNNIIYNNEILDVANQYNPTTGTVTIGNSSYWNVFNTVVGTITGNPAFTGVGALTMGLIKKVGSVYTIVKTNSIMINFATGPSQPYLLNLLASTYLNSGDELRWAFISLIDIATNTDLSTTVITNVVSVSTNTQAYLTLNGQITYGDDYEIRNVLPDITQTNFFMGIVKMFNLYVDVLPNGKLIIEPRDSYFLDDTIDWTYKLDVSKDFKIKPQGLLENKKIFCQYLTNGDDFSKVYEISTGFAFGYKTKIFDNEFVKDTKKIELPFALVPMNLNYGKVMMSTRYDGGSKEQADKPIIAFIRDQPTNGNDWRYYAVGSLSYTSYSTYPYAGHLSKVTADNSTYDLCFDRQAYYQWQTPLQTYLALPNQTLWNSYHYRQWEEIGDKDSKLVEAYFNLNNYDITSVSFRNIYWVKNAAYRLLEISDYNPNGNTTTLVKLLKLNFANPITATTNNTEGGGGQGGTTGGTIDTGGSGNGTGAISEVLGGIFKYNANNTVRSNGSLILGGNNQTENGGHTHIIAGSGNYISDNLYGVVLIGANNKVIEGNNVNIITQNYLDITANYVVKGNEGSPFHLVVGNLTGNIDINLPALTDNAGFIIHVHKTAAPHTIHIKDSVGATIDTINTAETKNYLLTNTHIIQY